MIGTRATIARSQPYYLDSPIGSPTRATGSPRWRRRSESSWRKSPRWATWRTTFQCLHAPGSRWQWAKRPPMSGRGRPTAASNDEDGVAEAISASFARRLPDHSRRCLSGVQGPRRRLHWRAMGRIVQPMMTVISWLFPSSGRFDRTGRSATSVPSIRADTTPFETPPTGFAPRFGTWSIRGEASPGNRAMSLGCTDRNVDRAPP